MTPTPADQAAPARPHPLRPTDVDRLADEIAEVACHVDAATHRLLTLIRRFDEGSGWALHGALSCAHWLNWRIGLDLGAARERVRVARALASLPLLDDALRRGAVSYSKTRAITRVATAATEAALLEMAQHATASQLERICRGYRRALDALDSERPESLADEGLRRFVRVRDTDDGMVRIEAQLRPEEAAVVLQALDVARRRAWRRRPDASTAHEVARDDVSSETPAGPPAVVARPHEGTSPHEPAPALSRADALVAVAEAYLSPATSEDAIGHAPAAPIELVVHVDRDALRADARAHTDGDGDRDRDRDARPRIQPRELDPTLHLATLADGTAIPLATAQRLACDAAVVTVTEDRRGDLRTLTRRTRRISATLRRALRLRDEGCRFPGCTNRLTDAHHVVAWARGGATRLGNLCSLCRRHHRLVHEHGYRIETAASGELRFLRRDGSVVPASDDRRAASGAAHRRAHDDASALLRDAHAARGLVIDSRTAFPRWDGEPIDHDLVVQALVGLQPGDGPPTDRPPA